MPTADNVPVVSSPHSRRVSVGRAQPRISTTTEDTLATSYTQQLVDFPSIRKAAELWSGFKFNDWRALKYQTHEYKRDPLTYLHIVTVCITQDESRWIALKILEHVSGKKKPRALAIMPLPPKTWRPIPLSERDPITVIRWNIDKEHREKMALTPGNLKGKVVFLVSMSTMSTVREGKDGFIRGRGDNEDSARWKIGVPAVPVSRNAVSFRNLKTGRWLAVTPEGILTSSGSNGEWCTFEVEAYGPGKIKSSDEHKEVGLKLIRGNVRVPRYIAFNKDGDSLNPFAQDRQAAGPSNQASMETRDGRFLLMDESNVRGKTVSEDTHEEVGSFDGAQQAAARQEAQRRGRMKVY